MNGNWLRVALFLAGLLAGGGSASVVGEYQNTKLEAEIKQLKDVHNKDVREIAERLSRIEEGIRWIKGRLQ
ncbi:MAG: hypothetical protein ACFFFO_17995 [Candidatus Thorarchaeota archaeon]